jgi:hypothetical protein
MVFLSGRSCASTPVRERGLKKGGGGGQDCLQWRTEAPIMSVSLGGGGGGQALQNCKDPRNIVLLLKKYTNLKNIPKTSDADQDLNLDRNIFQVPGVYISVKDHIPQPSLKDDISPLFPPYAKIYASRTLFWLYFWPFFIYVTLLTPISPFTSVFPPFSFIFATFSFPTFHIHPPNYISCYPPPPSPKSVPFYDDSISPYLVNYLINI